ncbi:hypothetical protein [Methylobacterium durans]|uniref:hypothetical protein n=1 Tax=Methylobacterium durans TaxID=2202825 RepID=UPI001F467F35|nr:hypothetical protein [Methylobacterium durans]
MAMLGAAVAAAGIALATPNYTASLVARVPEHCQAAAAGWLSSVHVLGQGIGALCGGVAFAIDPALPFWTCAAIGAALAACTVLLPMRAPDHRAA